MVQKLSSIVAFLISFVWLLFPANKFEINFEAMSLLVPSLLWWIHIEREQYKKLNYIDEQRDFDKKQYLEITNVISDYSISELENENYAGSFLPEPYIFLRNRIFNEDDKFHFFDEDLRRRFSTFRDNAKLFRSEFYNFLCPLNRDGLHTMKGDKEWLEDDVYEQLRQRARLLSIQAHLTAKLWREFKQLARERLII